MGHSVFHTSPGGPGGGLRERHTMSSVTFTTKKAAGPHQSGSVSGVFSGKVRGVSPFEFVMQPESGETYRTRIDIDEVVINGIPVRATLGVRLLPDQDAVSPWNVEVISVTRTDVFGWDNGTVAQRRALHHVGAAIRDAAYDSDIVAECLIENARREFMIRAARAATEVAELEKNLSVAKSNLAAAEDFVRDLDGIKLNAAGLKLCKQLVADGIDFVSAAMTTQAVAL